MSNVIIYDSNQGRQARHAKFLREQGYEVVQSVGLAEALTQTANADCRLLVLGLDALQPEDTGLWHLVAPVAAKTPVIALHHQLSQEVCETAARSRIAVVLPNSVSRDVFGYAVAQILRQQSN